MGSGKEIAYAANKLASLTGVMAGEILGLRGEYVYDNLSILQGLMEHNEKGFVFSLDGGATLVSRNTIYTGLHEALNKIGIGDAEIKRRGLSLHSWRYFLNTELQRQGLTVQQVQSVTGHKTLRMTEWYSHLDAKPLDTRQLEEVIKAQSVIVGTDKPKDDKPDAKDQGGNRG